MANRNRTTRLQNEDDGPSTNGPEAKAPAGIETVSRTRLACTLTHRFGDQLTPSVTTRSLCGRIVSARGPLDGSPVPMLERRTA